MEQKTLKKTQLYMFKKGKLNFVVEAENMQDAMNKATEILHTDAIDNHKKVKFIEIIEPGDIKIE